MSKSTGYPGSHQNARPGQNLSDPYRGQINFNFPAGGIEWKNTKNEEIATFYFKNGAFFRFDNHLTQIKSPVTRFDTTFNDYFHTINGNYVIEANNFDIIKYGDEYNKSGDIDKWQKHAEQLIKDYQKELHTLKRRFEIKRVKFHNKIDQAEGQEKSGQPGACASHKQQVKMLYTATPRIWVPASKVPGSNEITVATNIGPVDVYKLVSANERCFTCWGDGTSPSTQDGTWDKEISKDQITQKIVDLTEPLAMSEKYMGSPSNPKGGTAANVLGKNLVEQVGLVFNTSESYRKDPKGKLVPYGIKIDPLGKSVYRQYRESSLIEKVHVDSLAGGHYHLNVCDTYNLTVGANGISMKTCGDMDLFGINVNMVGENILISSNSEVALAGERIDLTGDIITLRPSKVSRHIEDGIGEHKVLSVNGKDLTEPEQQVFVDGNLNVGMNMIVAGGAHIEGEVSLQHISAPLEYQITETDFELEEQPESEEDCGTCGDSNQKNKGVEKNKLKKIVKGVTHADLLKGHKIGENSNIVPIKIYVSYGSSKGHHTGHIECGEIKIKSCAAESAIRVHPHYHFFKNLPLSLFGEDPLNQEQIELESTIGDVEHKDKLDGHSAVRAIGARNNFAQINLPMTIEDSIYNYTVMEKFKTSPFRLKNGRWKEDLPNYNQQYVPHAEGPNSSKYPYELVELICDKIEEFLDKKYSCLKDQLKNESKRKPKPSKNKGDNDGSAIGSRIGPGCIGSNPDGNLPGYAGNSSIYVGEQDPEAVKLSDAIESIVNTHLENITELEDSKCT